MITLEMCRGKGNKTWNMVDKGTNLALMYENVNALRREFRGTVSIRLMKGEGANRIQLFYARAGRGR